MLTFTENLPGDQRVGSAITGLTAGAAIGSAVLGGVYFAFSTAIMPTLHKRPVAESVGFFQECNRVIQNSLFLLVFTATAVVCALTAGSALFSSGGARGLRAAGGLMGLAPFVSTALINIPLNDRLDRDGLSFWATFQRYWEPANHLRAATSIVAAVLLLLAVRAER